MCRQVRLTLPAQPRAALQARRFVAAHCRDWGLAAMSQGVALPVSELVTNTLIHTDSAVSLTMSLSGEFLEVAVRDDSPRAPIVRPVRLNLDADIDALIAREHEKPQDQLAPLWHVGEAGSIAAGRGMLIVDAIADEWGVTQLAAGKEVWFRLRTPPAARSGLCDCPGSSTSTPGGLPLRI